jgi:hypothetical protein
VPNAGPTCGAFLDTVIIDFTPPTVNIGPDVIICEGESTPLTSTGLNIQNYTWDNAATLNNNTIQNPIATPAVTTTYTLTVEGAPGCEETDNVTVTVLPYADANILQEGSVCDNSATVDFNSVEANGVWSGTGIINTTTGIFDPAVAGAGLHTISYTTPGGCGSTDQISILVGETVDATILQEPNLCFNAPSFNLSSVEANGVWSGTGIIDQINGTFDALTA